MSDPNEPPRPDESGAGSGNAPPPPPGGEAPPPPPPTGANPYGAAGEGSGAGGYGDGGYGAPPPPPPGGGPYGQQAPNPYSPSDAWSFGWRHFTASPWTLLVPTLVIGIAVLVVSFLVRLIIVGGMTDSGSSLGVVLLAAAIAGGITSLITQVLAAGLYKGGAEVAGGRDVQLGGLFDGWDKVQVIVAALIIGVLTLIGTLLCYVPALIVAYFTQFTILFIVDKNMSATDAIKASFQLCVNNLGATILWFLLAAVTLIVGAILCLVGELVAIPVVLVGLAYTYRRLQGEPVVDPAPRTA
jgi:uncharacterized membrane protein